MKAATEVGERKHLRGNVLFYDTVDCNLSSLRPLLSRQGDAGAGVVNVYIRGAAGQRRQS